MYIFPKKIPGSDRSLVISKILKYSKTEGSRIRVYYVKPGGITITQRFYMWKDGYVDIPFSFIKNEMADVSNLNNCYLNGQRVIMTTSSFSRKYYGKDPEPVRGKTLVHKVVC